MQIDALSLIPEQSRTGFKLHKDTDQDRIHVWYRKPQGGRMVEHIFPKAIDLDESFVECLALSIGDGLNNPNKRNGHCNFANKNYSLVKRVMDWWISLGYNKERISVSIHAKIGSDGEIIKKEVDKYLNIETARVYFYNRNREPTIIIQLGNMVFQAFYLNLFEQLKSIIIDSQSFRRAFLRGLFAAEGHMKHSVFGTIESMDFSYNSSNEKNLAEYTKECLRREGIDAGDSGEKIYFCDYNRMLRFYRIGGLDLHENKRNKFIRLCRNAKIHVHVTDSILDPLRIYPQSKMAKYFGCCQSEVSHIVNLRRIKLSDLRKAIQLFGMEKSNIAKEIEYLQVKNSPIRDKEDIAVMLSLHEFEDK